MSLQNQQLFGTCTFLVRTTAVQLQSFPLFFLLLSIAMIIVIGKQYYRWNLVLDDGFWSIVTAMLLNGIGYVCLSFCMSEMSSTLPFSGGIYGFVRAFLGPYSGYIASRFEIILNICYVSSAALAIGAFPTYAGISSRNVEPAWWCLMYGFAMTMSLIGCSPYWAWNKVMGCTALVLMLVYILGSLPSVDYTAYANGNEAFNGAHFMSAFPYTSPMFLGIQYLPLISGKCSDVSLSHTFRTFNFDYLTGPFVYMLLFLA